MVESFKATAFRLWKTSPPWRYSVIAAALFGLLSVFPQSGSQHAPIVPPVTPPPVRPPPQACPLGQAACDYLVAYNQDSRLVEPLHCEKLAEAYDKLDDTAKNRMRASGSFRNQQLADGATCSSKIQVSDGHLSTVEQASIPDELLTAAAKLDDFDRTRTGKKATADKADAAIQASNERITSFTRAAQAFARSSPPVATSYLQLAQALRQLTPGDRTRMTSDEEGRALKVAADADSKLRGVQDRLVDLSAIVDRAQRDPSAEQQMTSTFEALSPDLSLARAVASPDQLQALAKAGELVRKSAWSQLDQKLRDLDRDPDNPARYAAVGITYSLIESLPSSSLTAEQQQLVSRAQQAQNKLSMSNRRLQAVLDAADHWARHDSSSGEAVTAALRDVEDHQAFDKPRFQARHNDAWAALVRAQEMEQALQSGLNSRTKSLLPICIAQSRPIQRLAGSVTAHLKAEGFLVTEDCKSAALVTTIKVLGDEPRQTQSPSGMIRETKTVHLDVSTIRSDTGQALSSVSGAVDATGIDLDNSDTVDRDTLEHEARAITDKFRAASEK
jgi:hypothetical protein